MHIAEVNIYKVSPVGDTWLWISVVTSDGLQGWGEAYDCRNADGVAAELEQLKPLLLNQDPRVLASRPSVLSDWVYPSRKHDFIHATVLCALDQACWDLYARWAGLPLYQLLGGYGQCEVSLYANLNRGLRTNRSLEALRARIEQAVQEGYEVVKVTPFDELQPATADPCPDNGLERIQEAARVLPISRIAVDCHQRFSRVAFARMMDRLGDCGIPYWIEDPMPLQSDEWKRLRGRYPNMRWAGGEDVRGLQTLSKLIHDRTVDVIMPDVKYSGGIRDLSAAISLAEHHELFVSLHNPSGPIATAFSAHLSTLVKSAVPMEFPFEAALERQFATIPPEPVTDGVYRIGSSAGIGLVPNPAFMEKYGSRWENGQWKSMKTSN
jgi:galactonate dehydratase